MKDKASSARDLSSWSFETYTRNLQLIILRTCAPIQLPKYDVVPFSALLPSLFFEVCLKLQASK